MEKEEFRIKIAEAIYIVKDIDEPFQIPAFKIILKQLLHSDNVFLKTESSTQTPIKKRPVKLLLPEIMSKVKPQNYIEKAILAAHYLFEYENVFEFNTNQITGELSKAKVIKPANMADTLNKLIKRGFLRESGLVDKKKGFEITEKGKEYAESLLTAAKNT